ncbi:MFS transporter [Streptomyces sp. NPDC006487]|uniref:MFS transporter n=1 Tax=Streptomyces sp. NPDC006487 TaxID=3364748 RepID=UPI0036929F13
MTLLWGPLSHRLPGLAAIRSGAAHLRVHPVQRGVALRRLHLAGPLPAPAVRAGPGRIGLALLGYGVPGLLLGPVIGRLADRNGRARIIPAGVALASVCVLLLATDLPLLAVALVIAVLSLGYDMTQPLLGGIVTDLPGDHGRRGQALGLNAFCLFAGFGLGSLAFQSLLPAGFTVAFTVFGVAALLAAVAAVPAFRDERAL